MVYHQWKVCCFQLVMYIFPPVVFQMPLTAKEKRQRKLEKKAQKLKEAEELRIKNRKVRIFI